ncbi:hypothetical protein R1flu_019029 [Riccia fluitans]|uniref:BTB domain-containing protein n=1 Tax=Riccia fluitans TaxID=41844 RepID=A0ABD1ZJR1_9MARC
MRSLRMTEGFKSSYMHSVSNIETGSISVSAANGKHSRTSSYNEASPSTSCTVAQLADPCIQPYFRPVDYVESLAEIHEELELAGDEDKARLYMEQSFVFRGLGESKMLRRSLRSARQHAVTVHDKLVLAAWLKYEKRAEELNEGSPTACTRRRLECPQSALVPGFAPKLALEPCACESPDADGALLVDECSTSGSVRNDIVFLIENERVFCNRQRISCLSCPFHAMLNGCFSESRATEIEFSDNGISPAGMRAVDEFSKKGRLGILAPELVLELLSFANRFCCEHLKEACDKRLAALVHSTQDAVAFLDYALEESAQVLVASCLQVFLRELPGSLQNPQIAALLFVPEGRKRFEMVGHSSFGIYSLLSQVAMEEDMNSDLSVVLLERAVECASSPRQKALALHQLGCVTFNRKMYNEAQEFFSAAASEGHVYSRAGIARSKYKRGLRLAAFAEASSILATAKPAGWMYLERALYCDGKEKLTDLNKATELDPTLLYPYKYRSAALMDEQKIHPAIEEINRVLGFKVTPDCLELRAYFCLALQDYQGATRDVRALLTLDPSYLMYSGRVPAGQLLRLLSQHVDQWTKADCWMQLYDHWSSVDDIGSLAVVHQMLESDPGKGLLFFRQSLLLLRLNCPKAAMRSLRLAREHASSDHERLVYEGWILYDTGHREEALLKAEESVAIQRSFEAFFLKAYALADTSLDPGSSAKVVELLEEALKCPSDGLRKGQALNNLGSVYVDCRELKLAADRYVSALKIRHTRAHQGLARVHHLEGDRKSAHEEMTKLIEKARNNASAYEKRSEYGERDMTMADLDKVTQLDPLRTYPYRYRAAVLMDSHREKEAIAELSKAIAFKADLQVLHLRAAFHECIGDLQASLRDCRGVLSMDPNHQDTLELHHRVHGREAY